jgi:tetratricopeptide (TPR) repeat protein
MRFRRWRSTIASPSCGSRSSATTTTPSRRWKRSSSSIPRTRPARTTLREIYTRGRSWRALLDLLRRELAFLDADARRSHLAEMAVLAAERLADLRQAISLWNEVLELAPGDRSAVTALAGLYEREKRWPALAEILGRLAESAGGEGSSEGCALLERRGLVLLEKLGAGQAALETLRRVHSAQPENPRVLRALREAYSQTGDIDALESLYAVRHAWDDLCDVLSGLAERTADMRLRTRAFERVADIARTRLGQTERVIKAYEGILATDPDNRAVARLAAELYEKTERWGRLIATYEILLGPESAPACCQPEESLPILERARDPVRNQAASQGPGLQVVRAGVPACSDDAKVRLDLERLGAEAEEWDNVARAFRRAARHRRQGWTRARRSGSTCFAAASICSCRTWKGRSICSVSPKPFLPRSLGIPRPSSRSSSFSPKRSAGPSSLPCNKLGSAA